MGQLTRGRKGLSTAVFRKSIAVFGAAVLAACSPPAATIFTNGDIITMNDAQPNAQAIAVRGGVIIAVGERADVERAAGAKAQVHDLAGKTLMPGFIDAHGHFGMGAFTSLMANLQPPPAGPVSNFEQLKEALVNWRGENPDADWIVGIGYDDSLLTEGRHPTRDDLDAVSTDTPIMLIHVSGHLLTCNSACLALGGVTADTADPDGGIIRRKPGSREPDGVLEETAMALVQAKMPMPGAREAMSAIKAYQDVYAGYGITTAQDGASTPELIKLLKGMATLGQLKLDVAAYPRVGAPADFTDDIVVDKAYKKHFRVGGIKLILDGSPQGKTAWLTHPYHVVPEGSAEDYAGYATMKTDDVESITEAAFARGVQVIAHANGDAAADQLLGAVARANAELGAADRRTVMIHAQTARDDQISAMKAEGVIPSYFVAHTFFWGDWHRDSVLGPERGARISPLQSTINEGLTYTIHNDAPIVPPDMMRLAWTAVNRETRSGKVLGPNERVSPLEAFKAITLNAAYQYFEGESKGSLEVGKLADFTILSANPLKVPPGEIKDIQVVETLKEGETIFKLE